MAKNINEEYRFAIEYYIFRIGTADIKDLYVDDKPVLGAFDFRFARRFSIPVRLSLAR